MAVANEASGSNSIKPTFPPELLSASNEKREEYFHEVVVSHDNFDAILKTIRSRLTVFSNRRIVILTGPSGVGKSAVSRAIVKLLNEQSKRLKNGLQQIPAIAFSPESPAKGDFRFESLYEDALACMNAPLISDSRAQESINVSPRKKVLRLLLNAAIRRDIPGLRNRCVNLLDDYGVILWVIEEAKTVFVTGKSKSAEARKLALEMQADKLKLLVEEGQTTLMLVGGRDLVEVSVLTDQLSRRTRVLHFEAYTEQTIRGFVKGFLGLISKLPTKHSISIEDAPEFFRRSNGTIGTTHDTLDEALHRHLVEGIPFDMKLVRECFLDSDQEVKMAAPFSAPPGDPPSSDDGASTTGQKKERRRRVEAKPTHNKKAAEAWKRTARP